jgi:hypothetical protein
MDAIVERICIMDVVDEFIEGCASIPIPSKVDSTLRKIYQNHVSIFISRLCVQIVPQGFSDPSLLLCQGGVGWNSANVIQTRMQ